MDTEDGYIFIKNLAYFVRTHEKALANALLLQQQQQNARAGHGASTTGGLASPSSPHASSSSLASFLPFSSRPVKPAKLTLTPHHLFYLLSRFQELGIVVGAMDVRLENIHTTASPANYVSFLNQAQRRKIMSNDRDSIHSVSSIRSVMSTMTSLWSSLGFSSKSNGKSEKHKAAEREDLRYLYSAFTKVPCLKLSPDHKAPLIAGYEEFPFDSAVPLFAFKNLTSLDICDVDFRQFFGWDRLSDPACGVRSLTLKRACVDDPVDVLVNIVLDDMDRRRRRSAKVPTSPMAGWPPPSPGPKNLQLVNDSRSAPGSPPRDRQASNEGAVSSSLESTGSPHPRRRSASPTRPGSSLLGSSVGQGRTSTPIRRSSGSSNSSLRAVTPRGSTTTLLSFGLPVSRWRCLRHLSLSENGLTTISASSLSPVANTLQSLDISSNLFTEIPDSLASLVALRALNLSHCMIESLHSLVRNPLPAITVLNLRANRLASLAGIERLLSLERVDLRENRLRDPTEIARLTGIPNMTDVYISKNPFVKSYNNYRTIIFNLFRKTPGYSEDIYIDGSQPLYSERKHLADRVPEPAVVPIVKPRPVEVEPKYTKIAPIPSPTPPTSMILQPNVRLERTLSEPGHRRHRSEHGGNHHRRKKGNRRRIVDISQQDSSVDIRTESTLVDSPATKTPELKPSALPADEPSPSPVIKEVAIPDRTSSLQIAPSETPQSSVGLPPTETYPPILRTGSDPMNKLMPSALALEFGTESDLYRQKIQALRNDLGPGWLSALGDDTWDNHPRPNGFDGSLSPPGPLTPPAAPIRSTSQGIVSGGRTLG